MIAGCNFWGWGGRANVKHVIWQPYDDYVCDPAQEEQGLNSVFASDTTTPPESFWKNSPGSSSSSSDTIALYSSRLIMRFPSLCFSVSWEAPFPFPVPFLRIL